MSKLLELADLYAAACFAQILVRRDKARAALVAEIERVEAANKRLLTEAERILHEALRAIGKIQVERIRGAGYFHAEVDWLVNEEANIRKLCAAIEAVTEGSKT